ncbi:trifunctional dihydropteroate synthetase [Tilletia horrida]|uniref:Trifunctional dihydropteroate synthetase n=1 Tax=Tilletia horrida TaxID=155126 RepID=A0AAN6GUU9_9BASI|nr:trifunctional dihydropteroate synthetase [Tilletia horrida]
MPYSTSAPHAHKAHLATDTVHLVDLQLPLQRFTFLNDLWDRSSTVSPQPAIVTVQISTDLSSTALTDGRDSLAGTVNYGTASKAIIALASGPASREGWNGIEQLTDQIASLLLGNYSIPAVTVAVKLPRALLSADGLEYVAEWHRIDSSTEGSKGLVCVRQHYTVHALRLQSLIGLNDCERQETQPIVVTAHFEPTPQEKTTDAQPCCWNPRNLVKSLSAYIAKQTDYGTVESLSTDIARYCFAHPALQVEQSGQPSKGDQGAPAQPVIERIAVRVDKPSAVLMASAAGVEVVRERAFFEERPHSQRIPSYFANTASLAGAQQPITTSERKWTAFLSLGSNLGLRSAYIHSALRLLVSARRIPDAEGKKQWSFPSTAQPHDPGDGPWCELVDTSFMYETAPMYVEDQPRFLNAAAQITTRLTPLELLDLTQSIEAHLGRDHALSLSAPKGPRVVDLDMIWHDGAYQAESEPSGSCHGHTILDLPRLKLPHVGIAEREFVLRPLSDICPDWRHPVHGRTVSQMLLAIEHDPAMRRVVPIRTAQAERTLTLPSRTYLMSIINTTPDSFSDGGAYHNNADATVQAALDMTRVGADILDIGGMSTAPGRPDVDEKEEAGRVVPIVLGIRQHEATLLEAQGSNGQTGQVNHPAIISIDTFRPSVARAALDAGASMINDVTGARGNWSDQLNGSFANADSSANALGDEMLALVAERGAPIVLMHMRGTSRTMTSQANTTYNDNSDSAVVAGVREELRICVERALRAGVPRWNIILDPGIGFAKTREGSLALLRRVGEITSSSHERSQVRGRDQSGQQDAGPNLSLRNFPILLGPSRKRFLAPTTAYQSQPAVAKLGSNDASAAMEQAVSDPRDRVFSTAAACAAGVAGGVDIVRVHDTREMKDVVRTADAIWRGI